jgi:hypothetical protein
MTDAPDDPLATVPRPKFKVRGFIDPDQMAKDITFSPNDLTNAMMAQASMFAHYGVLLSKASRQVDDVKMVLEVTEAKVYRKLRDAALTAGTKMTETMLDKAVSISEPVIAIKRALNEAKQIEAQAKTAVEAFRHRRDMLIQQGFLHAQEMKGEVSIARRNNVESEVDGLKSRLLARTSQEG